MWLLYMMKHITYNTAMWLLYMMKPDSPAIQPFDCCTFWNQTYLQYSHVTAVHDETRLTCNTSMWLLYMMKSDLPAIQPCDCCTWWNQTYQTVVYDEAHYLQYIHVTAVHDEIRLTCNTAMWLLYMMKPDLPAIQPCDCCTWWNQREGRYSVWPACTVTSTGRQRAYSGYRAKSGDRGSIAIHGTCKKMDHKKIMEDKCCMKNWQCHFKPVVITEPMTNH